jgi:F-type H+-transporting ATPase subunit b
MFQTLPILAQTHAEATSAVAEHAAPATEQTIFQTFKILPELFIPQVISFLVVAFLLKKFAFGPIQAMLEQRKQRIADGENKLKQIEQQLADSEKHTAAAIAEANATAKRLIEEAKSSASALTEQKAQEAISQAQNILAKAEAAAKAERAQISADLKREFGRLVANTAQQATGGKLTADQQRSINEEALARVEA